MPEKKLLCKPCNSLLGTFENGKIRLKNMKALSDLDIDTKTGTSDIKCHACHNWNTIDKNGDVTLNEKKKSQDMFDFFYKSQKQTSNG